ncbi:MAG: hypothetical protein ACE5M4_09780 [Anaerolineales bacterium]
MAFLDPASEAFSGWLGYLVLALLGALSLWAVSHWLGAPRTIVVAASVAVALRLLVALGLGWGLPRFGYPNSDPHVEGYLYIDSLHRDADAWELAQSSGPLSQAFTEPAESDQYGGLLFVSGLLYRTFTPDVFRPMLVATLAALSGGLAVLFTWGFTAAAFGSRPAALAGWGMALYPEAVLLGASQMREPFLIALLAGALYSYARLRNGQLQSGIATIAVASIISLALSPPFTVLMLAVILLALVWEGRVVRRAILVGVAGFAILGGFALVVTLTAWQGAASVPVAQPLYLLETWIARGAEFELYRLEEGSGWVQFLFGQTPEWTHIPMATGNGLVQPFLPATLMDSTSLPLPRAIGIARALGWFILLPFLIYAPFAALRSTGWRSLQTYLSLVVWIVIIGASYRLAGDQWDNPRARAVLLAPQVALAGWIWYHAQKVKSPWLLRSGVLVGVASLLFIHWYAGRYYQTPRLNLFETVAVLAIFIVVFLVGAIVLDIRRARRTARLTAEAPEV